MPFVGRLCWFRVVSSCGQDAHGWDLLVLVVISYTDAAPLQQAFAGGADDFITQLVLGLVTRVISRLQRVRSRLQAGGRASQR